MSLKNYREHFKKLFIIWRNKVRTFDTSCLRVFNKGWLNWFIPNSQMLLHQSSQCVQRCLDGRYQNVCLFLPSREESFRFMSSLFIFVHWWFFHLMLPLHSQSEVNSDVAQPATVPVSVFLLFVPVDELSVLFFCLFVFLLMPLGFFFLQFMH